MMRDVCYQPDLAWIHDVGYSEYVVQATPGILELLRCGGLSPGSRVLDVGCGSGVLAHTLSATGFEVEGTDASPAMIALARERAPRAHFQVQRLPSGRPPGAEGELPLADAVVSTGHVLNYLDTFEDIEQALAELAQAVRPGGMLAIDLMTERYCEARNLDRIHARVEEDWAIVTRFARPAPRRFDRMITVFRRVDGQWRRSDEQHRTLSFEADDALRALHGNGIVADVQAGFGNETLPEGMIVLVGLRR